MGDVKRWWVRLDYDDYEMMSTPPHKLSGETLYVLASDYDALVAAASELWTYSDHTHTCKVNDTGDSPTSA